MPVLTKAYAGRAEITFHEAKHYYTVRCPGVFEEQLYQPGVTTIIGLKDKSQALVTWATQQMADRLTGLAKTAPSWDTEALIAIIDAAKDTWRKKKEAAADIGTIAHNVIEKALHHDPPKRPLTLKDVTLPGVTQDMIDQANNAIDAGLQFIRENEIDVVQAETPRWSPTYGYIGTNDLIAWINGKLSVLDWKTSKRLYPTVRLQLSAYAKAYEEEFRDQHIEQGVAVNIGKDGKLTTEKHTDKVLAEDFPIFLALLELWRWDRENQGQWSKPAPRRLTQLERNLILAA